METANKVMRIENLIDRLDDRGAELICKAIENCGGPLYDEYLVSLKVIAERCRKLAMYIDGLSRPNPRRRSA